MNFKTDTEYTEKLEHAEYTKITLGEIELTTLPRMCNC